VVHLFKEKKMAITPVQKKQTVQTRASGGKMGQKVGAGLGTIIGAGVGFATGGPAGIAPGALKGATAGASLGGIAGEALQPAKFKDVSTNIPQVNFSPQGQSFVEALQILQKLPSSISAHHTGPITAALMKDIAHNRRA
jgi:hypothetical protein